MIRSPYPGQRCRIWYAAAKVRRAPARFPHHGEPGIVAAVARGPGPRNVLVELVNSDRAVVVPRGNLDAV